MQPELARKLLGTTKKARPPEWRIWPCVNQRLGKLNLRFTLTLYNAPCVLKSHPERELRSELNAEHVRVVVESLYLRSSLTAQECNLDWCEVVADLRYQVERIWVAAHCGLAEVLRHNWLKHTCPLVANWSSTISSASDANFSAVVKLLSQDSVLG